MTRIAGSRTFILGVVAGLALIYALCYAAISAGLDASSPLVFAGLALAGVLVWRRRPLLPARQDWRAVVTLALIPTTLGFGAMFLSPGRAGVGISSVLGNIQPLIAVVLGVLFLSERFTRARGVALLFGVLGVVLIALPDLTGSDAYAAAGVVLALTASLAGATGSVVVKRMGAHRDMLVIAAWQLLLGSLPLLAGSLVLEGAPALDWSVKFTALLLFLALPGTALAVPVWYWLLDREEVGRASMLLFLVPVLGLGTGTVLFNERLTGPAIAGVAVILAGIGVIAWDFWHAPAVARDPDAAPLTTAAVAR